MRGMIVVVTLAFALCAGAAAQAAQDPGGLYTVGPDDVLEVNVLRPDQISSVVTVGPDGSISFPYIGSVHVNGHTLDRVQEEVRDRLADGYMRYPDVAVALKESRSKKVFITGEVLRPGYYPADETTTILKAISMAGGFTKSGSFGRGKVLRPRRGRGGGHDAIDVNIKGMMQDPANDANIPLRAGDTLVVLEDTFFIQGEVTRPGAYPVEDTLTLLKAISVAGGLKKAGADSQVKLVRPRKGRGDTEIRRISLKAVMNGADPASNLEIQPGDTIVVSEDRFYVYGAVNRPGTYTIDENVTVMKAISMVGGFTKFGSSNRVKILRPKRNGRGYETIKVNLKGIMDGSDDGADVLLQPEDTVVVSEGIF